MPVRELVDEIVVVEEAALLEEGALHPADEVLDGSLVFVLGDALVRVAIGTALSLTAVPLPEDAKRVTTLVALDDDDIWFTGPQGGSREALFHTASADAGAATEWPAP